MSGQEIRNPDDEEFARAAARILRASAVDVDAATQARLQQARRTALAAWPGRRAPIRAFGPAFAVAAAAVVAVALWLGDGSGRVGGVPGTQPTATAAASDVNAGDVDFLTTGSNMEMIQNLEFFSWLDADRSDEELRSEMEAVSSTGA